MLQRPHLETQIAISREGQEVININKNHRGKKASQYINSENSAVKNEDAEKNIGKRKRIKEQK